MSRFLDIAEDVLRFSHGHALTVGEIWARAEEWQLIPPEIAGLTPRQTLKSKLSVDIRLKGETSRFARTAPGRFVLREDLGGRPVYIAEPPPLPGSAREPVVCIPIDSMREVRSFQGLSVTSRPLASEVLESAELRVVPRDAAEERYDVKQLIVYVVVRRRSRILAYTRGSRTRVEDFLKGSRCVGFGGHVGEPDLSGTLFAKDSAGVFCAAARELSEELKLPEGERARLALGEGLSIVGVINDDSSLNGRRHLGVLMEFQAGEDVWWDRPVRGEQAITRLEWLDPGSPELDLSEFEYWSQLALRGLYGSSPSTAAGYRVLHPSALARPHVVCLVGPVGSGKTEAAEGLHRLFGYALVNSGRVLASILGIPAVPSTPREVFQSAAERFIMDPDGPMLLSGRIASAILSERNYVIDGIRHRGTLRHLRTALGDRRLCVVYVHTSPDVAFEFFRDRERPEIDALRFYEIRGAPVEGEVESLLREADVVLYNWQGVDRYMEVLRSLFDEHGPSHS